VILAVTVVEEPPAQPEDIDEKGDEFGDGSGDEP